MMEFYSITTTTPVGDFHMIVEHTMENKNMKNDVVLVSGFGNLDKLRKRLPKELQSITLEEVKSRHPYEKFIVQYFKGDSSALKNIPYQQTGSEFNQDVWHSISKVKFGKTISYKELALKAGRPAAIRAVGTACGLNRLVLIIPCHRIIRSDGKIGEYLYGQKIKNYLLETEKAAKIYTQNSA